YKQRWFLDTSSPMPRQAFLKHVETAQGTKLALLCLRTVRTQNVNYYLIGGKTLDSVLQSLSPPEGLRVSIYSVPEQGSPEILGGGKSNLDPAKLQTLIQSAVDKHGEASNTINWGGDGPQEEIVHAVALRGYSDRVPAVLLVGNSLDKETALEDRIRNISLLIAGVGVLVGVVGSGLVAARISRPVKKLADAAAKVGQGDWNVAVEPGSDDEIGRLAEAFNQMTHELLSQRERLVQSERVAAWRELARRLAHELKNPLFPLQITVENLMRARQNNPAQFEEVFRESTDTLL